MAAFKDRHNRWRYRFARRGIRYHGSTLKGNNTKAAAEKLERAHIEKLERNIYTGVMPTVREFIERYLEHQRSRVKPSTYRQQRTALSTHVEPELGRLPLDGVGKLQIDALVTKWRRAWKPGSVNARLSVLASMFALAVEWKILAAVPTIEGVDDPRDTPRFLSHNEAELLLESSMVPARTDSGDWHSMVLFGLRTGLRVGELRGLQWADLEISGDRGTVYVRRTDPGRPGQETGTTKSGRVRMVPLTPDAHAIMREHLDRERARLGERWSPSSWVWPNARNHERTRSDTSCTAAITRFAKRAKLVGVGWHTLRHTFASWLVIRGTPIRIVQELLGHASITMTERYAHLAPGAVNHAVVASLDLPMIGAPVAPQLPPGDDDD